MKSIVGAMCVRDACWIINFTNVAANVLISMFAHNVSGFGVQCYDATHFWERKVHDLERRIQRLGSQRLRISRNYRAFEYQFVFPSRVYLRRSCQCL